MMKIRVLLLSLSIFLFTQYSSAQAAAPSVEEGLIDVSHINFSEEENIKLQGQWEFYWNAFITSEDFQEGDIAPPLEYISVPGSWTVDTDHPAHGFGTMRILIIGLTEGALYSLYIPDIISSYTLTIDGREFSANGRVSDNRRDSRPQFLPRTITFSALDNQAEIIIHISNFNYRKSGIWRNLYLGSQDKIRNFRERRMLLDASLAAIILTISIFHIGVFLYRRKERAEFFFGLICLTFVIRIICTGEQILTFFIPSFPWEILRRLEYIPFYGTASLLALFMISLFPRECIKTVNYILLGIFSMLGVFIIIFPVRISNYSMVFAQMMMILGILYALVVMVRALGNKREGSAPLLAAYALFSLAVINDILYANQFIQTLYTSPLGFVVFIIIQSQMLTRKFTKSFSQREILARSRDKFKFASITDGLTGLYNVRYLHEILEKSIPHARGAEKPLSVIMADVDNFKQFNDTWGHKQGDEVLKKIAEIIRTSARENDSPCRYGGEEFSVVFPDTTLEMAAEVSERIRLKFELAEESDKKMKGITVSIGVAQYQEGESHDELIDRADKALYEAKHRGKNRVVLAK
ncbi:MAG: diguanylate cyclase [Spirochaetaceae bacterium]|nr:diguanylate cyclase [Spirochaetaceae bacterium]